MRTFTAAALILAMSCQCLADPTEGDKNVRVQSQGTVLLETSRTMPTLEIQGVQPGFDKGLRDRFVAPQSGTKPLTLPVQESKDVTIEKWSIPGNKSVDVPSGSSKVLQVKAGKAKITVDNTTRDLSEGDNLAIKSESKATITTSDDSVIIDVTAVK